MPSRNIIKVDSPETYYHVYSRGLNKQVIFKDDDDYRIFLSLLKRYLSKEPEKNLRGAPYAHFYGEIEVIAYCLMPNHYHLLIYQEKKGAMQQLMRRIVTSYSGYFNQKYNRRGPLFESRYKASSIYNHQYLEHISRYIHLNPEDWRTYRYSSLNYYLGAQNAEWIKPERILSIFQNSQEYLKFLCDYEGHKKMLEAVKHELADN